MQLSLAPLIDVTSLSDHLHDPSLRLFDATVELIRPPEGGPYTVHSGREGYEEARIPGAAFADIPGDLSDPDSPFAFTLPAPSVLPKRPAGLGRPRWDLLAKRSDVEAVVEAGDAAACLVNALTPPVFRGEGRDQTLPVEVG